MARCNSVIWEFTISADVLHPRLVTGVVAGSSAIPFAAIILWAVAGTLCDVGVVDIRGEWCLRKSLLLCYVESLDFSKIIAPVSWRDGLRYNLEQRHETKERRPSNIWKRVALETSDVASSKLVFPVFWN